MGGPGTDEVHIIDPGQPPKRRDLPQVIWAAPGSLFVQEVARAWSRRGLPVDLGAVSGPWGVVLWEPRSETYLVACDPLGVQPLFWARTEGGGIGVASWLARLVDRPDVDDSLDLEGILFDEGFETRVESVLDRTRFAGVSQVPWGRMLRVAARGATSLERYWQPEFLPEPDESLTLSECAELLRSRIDAAVRRLTPTDRPVGAHVSGGVDCTAVACRANQVLTAAGKSLVAGYSWAPDERRTPPFEGDERHLLADVTAQEGFRIRTVYPDESGDWFRTRDPNRYGQSTHAWERYTLPQAHTDGVRVMLSGWGGDEFASFPGRGVVRDLVRRRRFLQVWRHTAGPAGIELSERKDVRRRMRAFAASLVGALPPRLANLRDRAGAAEWRQQDAELDALLRGVYPRVADARLERARAVASLPDHRATQLFFLSDGHLQHRTSWWYQTGRLFNIEYRYPLLDLGVVSAALRLPAHAFRSGGWTRLAYRMAVAPWVPPAVAWNARKAEPSMFSPPVVHPVPRSNPLPPLATVEDSRYPGVIELVDATYRRLNSQAAP